MLTSAALRKLWPLLPLPLVVALAAWGSARAADAGGAMLGAALSAVAGVVGSEQRPSEEEFEFEGAIPVSILGATGTPGDATTDGIATAKGKKARSNGTAQVPARAVFVSADKVLKLAESRAKPRGVRVPASGERPAGLALKGVEGLGIGLREGDVLTRAVGQPALSSSAVVRAVLVARARRAKVLEGEFYRGRERWALRVEQPYLEDPRTALTGVEPGPRLLSP
jgi:hypothetical protein